MMKKNFKLAMATTELAVSICVVVVVLIFAVSLFGNSLVNITKSGLTNFFKADNKTDYISVMTDYADSQINVQVTGAQGLEMIRQKANNKALALLSESKFKSSNPNGNLLAYYAKVVEIISGETHFCSYITKPSMLHCEDIGSYEYKVPSVNALTIISKAKGTISPAVDGAVSSVISDSKLIVPIIPEGEEYAGYPELSIDEKYEYLQYLTIVIMQKGAIDQKYLLINFVKPIDTKIPKKVIDPDNIFSSIGNDPVKKAVAETFTTVNFSLGEAHELCRDKRCGIFNLCNIEQKDRPSTKAFRTNDRCPARKVFSGKFNANKYVSGTDTTAYTNLLESLNTDLKTATSNEEITKIVNKYLNSIVQAAQKDTVMDSCKLLINGIENINATHNTNITVPRCVPN